MGVGRSRSVSAARYGARLTFARGFIAVVVAGSGALVGAAHAAPSSGPGGVPLETVAVASNSSSGSTSSLPLVAGLTYTFDVTGTYTPGAGTTADAECSATLADSRFIHDRYASLGSDYFGLQVQGKDVLWTPASSDALPGDSACNSTDHHYSISYLAPATGTVNFRVVDTFYGDNVGTLSVAISLASGPGSQGTLVDDFYVDSANPAGATSSVTMTSNNRYRVLASGTFAPGGPGITEDAACQQSNGAPGVRSSLDGSTAPVLVNSQATNWSSTQVAPPACNDKDHTYTFDLPAASTGAINVAVRDTYYPDNRGFLHIQVFLNPPVSPTQAP